MEDLETDCHGLQASLAMTGEKETAQEILQKLAVWVQTQEQSPSRCATAPFTQGGLGVAEEILQKLAVWVQAQEPDKLSVQNLKHATSVLKDLRDILKSDMPDKPVEIVVQIGNGEYAK